MDGLELEPSARLLAALEGVGVIGEWSFDYAAQIFRSSPGISEAFAIDPEAGERGQPVEVYERAVHPDDVTWLRSTRATAPGWSGLRVTELRVTGSDGLQRWIMVRGRFVLDKQDRPILGYGVMLELTSYHDSGDQPLVTPAAPFAEPLFVLLDSLSTAYRAAGQLAYEAIERCCRALLFRSAKDLAHRNSARIPFDSPEYNKKWRH